MALAAAPSHAGDNIRGGPLRTAKERLGGKASDEQHAAIGDANCDDRLKRSAKPCRENPRRSLRKRLPADRLRTALPTQGASRRARS